MQYAPAVEAPESPRQSPAGSGPPIARRIPKVNRKHGIEWIDNFAWLKDRRPQKDPAIVAHLEAENAYTDAVLQSTIPLQEQIFQEITGRLELKSVSVPEQRGDYLYYERTEENLDYKIHCRKFQNESATEEIVLDENALAAGHDYHKLESFSVSPDNRYFAYGVNHTGRDVFDLYIRDLTNGSEEFIPDISNERENELVWSNDSRTLFYTRADPETQRSFRVFSHRLGTDHAGDALLSEESDELFNMRLGTTHSHRYMTVRSESSDTSEIELLDLDNPDAPPLPVLGRTEGVRYDVDHHPGGDGEAEMLYIRTDEQALNFRIVKAPLSDPSRNHWVEVVPHDEAVQIETLAVYRDHLVLDERYDGLTRIRVRRLSTGEEHFISFPDPTYFVETDHQPDFESSTLRFRYQSLVQPETIYDYEMNSRERRLRKRTAIPSGYQPELYTSERIWATAEDGTRVPISLVYRKDFREASRKPLFLTGYGSYGYPFDPGFPVNELSLIDRGFTYAIAHIRGGGELGEKWRLAGNLMNKKNTFTDFIDCARHLLDHGYASITDGKSDIAIEGRSAGGLLIGAVCNMTPELFRAAIAGVPFVDVINTMLDDTLPLTVQEYLEWGNPNEKAAFEYIMSYSPCDNIKTQEYPHMLVTGGLNDPRVPYWEAAKFVAKLRELKTDNNMLLLKMYMSGHYGQSGRSGHSRDRVLVHTFLLNAL